MIHTRVQRNQVGATNPESIEGLHISLTEDSIFSFRKILLRALNTWPECPAEWKELADLIEHGTVLQDYNRWHHKLKQPD